MTAERWRIKKALSTVSETDPAEMPSRLDMLCEGDEELRREVEILLALREDPDLDLLESTVVAMDGLALCRVNTTNPAWETLGLNRRISKR
jgi:hypothetical protein